MNIDVKRVPGAGVANGGHALSEDIAFACPQEVAALRLTYTFSVEELREGPDGDLSATIYMTRDEAHEFASALVDCTCDG